MSSNYGLILVVLTVVSGIIWLWDALTAGKDRKAALAKLYEQDKEPSEAAIKAVTREPIHVDYAKSFFPILFFIVVLRSWLWEPFQIPSASMKPTLTEGDFILVNKFNYGLRMPVTSTKFVDIGSPQRGDIAVFRAPNPPHEDYIKRVIGLPGDTVIYTANKKLYIQPLCPKGTLKSQCPQKKLVERELVSRDYKDIDPETGDVKINEHYIEEIGDTSHGILVNPRVLEANKARSLRVYKVPPGHYFVMGDNRDNSFDSRYWKNPRMPRFTNFVPEENLVGEAVSIWLHLDFGIKNEWFSWIPTGVDFGRVGSIE